MKYNSLPAQDGFMMPAEFSPHEGTIMIFPERPGSWGYGAKPAQKIFAKIISEIAKDEFVIVVVSENTEFAARKMLSNLSNIRFVKLPTDDAWARDTAPTFVSDGEQVRGIDWQFNAWGGIYDGLYAHWENDNALAGSLCDELGIDVYDAQDFVLEGGSVHSNGQGIVMTTESCLLSKGRNPHLSKQQIEDKLRSYLGAKKVIWLPRGIYNDETNEHVDNVCAFISPDEVVLAWTDDEDDPQYPYSAACLETLLNEGLKVHKLLIPDFPVRVTQHDLDGLVFEEGEDEREVGERLAASYVNFYFTNRSVLLPQFGGENAASDLRAVNTMKKLCPQRRIIPIDAREIIIGGGNIHCITQQIPKGADLCAK